MFTFCHNDRLCDALRLERNEKKKTVRKRENPTMKQCIKQSFEFEWITTDEKKTEFSIRIEQNKRKKKNGYREHRDWFMVENAKGWNWYKQNIE